MTDPLLFRIFGKSGDSGRMRESPSGSVFAVPGAVFRFFRFACLHFPRERGKVLNRTGCRGYPGGNAVRDHAPETSNNEGETT